MIKRVFLLVAMAIGVSSLSAQVKFQSGTMREIYTLAKESNKFVFVDLYADWCPPCKAMERDVFSREDIGQFMGKHFVCAKYNIDNQLGKDLASQYVVRSIPTFLIFDQGGKLMGRLTGGMSPEDLKSSLLKIIDK
ncbi:MAG: thioredoxin family protein [Rikenellaceae bacterium]